MAPVSELTPNDPRLGPLRGKEPIEGWLGHFSKRDPERSRRYLFALHVFLGYPPPRGQTPDWASRYVASRSPNTLRAYRTAISEFWEFLRAWHQGKIVAPHEVSRQDAFDYAEWLANRGRGRFAFSVAEEKLKDGQSPDELAIYEAVKRSGKAKLSQVARDLPRAVKSAHPAGAGQQTTQLVGEAWLHERLTWLVHQDLLVRTPRWVELRQKYKNINFASEIDLDTYTYLLPDVRPCSRATIALRLGALSSFWRIMQRGENDGGKALLDYNVFDEPLERVSRGVGAEKRAASAEKRPSADLVSRILEAAEKDTSLTGKRNLALLWFLLVTGARVTEALRLRRAEPPTRDRNVYPGWLDTSSTPWTVLVVRKGGTRQRLPVPSYPMAAIKAFWVALGEAAPAGAAVTDPSYRYRLLVTERDAPLFPALRLWGKNRPTEKSAHGLWAYRKSMGQPAVAMLLCRLSHDAGLGDKDRARIHAHGFRHAAAQAMADMKKPLLEVKTILGHASVKTTEQYLEDETDLTKLDGQAEVLEWLSKKGRLPVAPGPVPQATAVPVPPRVIETEAVELPRRRPAPISRQLPAHDLPTGPEPPLKAFVVYQQPTEIALSELAEGETPGRPTEPYEYLFRGKKPKDLTWAPDAGFVKKEYPKLPPRFGIGEESLLVWWNPDAPTPWPVLAPGQAYPELTEPHSFLGKLEHLYEEWSSEPTRTIALAKWLLYLGMVTVGLERRINAAYLWVPYEAVGKAGRDLRAHDDDWLVRWFRENAHTFTVAARRYMGVRLPTATEGRDEYWESVRERLETLGSVPSAAPAELPEWFFEADPVHAIYTRDPGEWRAFARWISRLTGVSEERGPRGEHRHEQTAFFEESHSSKREQLSGIIEQFYALVDETRAAARDRSKAESRQLSEELGELRRHVAARYGLELPSEAPKEHRRRRERIEELVDKCYPDERAQQPTANVLGDSRLFSPEAYRLNDTGHTLEHTRQYKELFARENYGQDSECVMRRIARALWEQVRSVEYGRGRPSRDPRDVTRYLFVTQLAQLAYVVPCPPDIEKQLRASGLRVSSPADIRRELGRIVEAARGGKEPTNKAEQTAQAILEVFGEHPAELEAPAGRDEDDEGLRYRKNPGRQRAVLPHPLRLVAASFWPV